MYSLSANLETIKAPYTVFSTQSNESVYMYRLVHMFMWCGMSIVLVVNHANTHTLIYPSKALMKVTLKVPTQVRYVYLL